MRNVDQREARQYLITLAGGLGGFLVNGLRVFVLPPATLLPGMAEVAKGTQIWLGAQNFHWEEEGEFTGELSTALLTTVLMQEHRYHYDESDGLFALQGAAAESILGCPTVHLLSPLSLFTSHWADFLDGAAPVARGFLQSVETIKSFPKRSLETDNPVRLIYGGNVNLSNCREIVSVSGIDGLFVGGAAADQGVLSR